MVLYKYTSGLILDDDFSAIDPRWLITPSGSFHFEEGSLILQHNESESASALFEIPEEDNFVFQVTADYVPKKFGDEGGLLIWQSALNKLEFLERYESSRVDEYNVWQARKRGNLWSFFAHRSNQWELFDSSVIADASMMGVTLKGSPRDGFVPLNINRVVVCKGTHLLIGNISEGFKVELLNDTGDVVTESTVPTGYAGTELELPLLPFEGRVRIYDSKGNLTEELLENTLFYGGDVYFSGTELKVLWKGEELNVTGPTYLGALKRNQIREKMTLLNPTEGNVAEEVELSIKQYLEEFGWEWADVALDIDGAPGEFGDVIQFEKIEPLGSVDFWVQVKKTSERWGLKPTHFFFDITHV
jgi:hypothetical protein